MTLTFTKAELLDEDMEMLSETVCSVEVDLDEHSIDFGSLDFPPVKINCTVEWVRFSCCSLQPDKSMMVHISAFMELDCLQISKPTLH